MNEREIQKTKILNWIANHGFIDAITAVEELGILRLAARIADLKKDGWPIFDRWAYNRDTSGKVLKKWKEYYIPLEVFGTLPEEVQA